MNKEVNSQMPDKKTNEHLTDFGYQTIPEEEKESHVKEVFDEVAPKYDIMNDVLSFGMHRLWKKYTVDKAAVKPGMNVLDIAGGTGDLLIAMADKIGDGKLWLTDINLSMLRIGKKRMKQHHFDAYYTTCDAEALPFPDDYFDVITVAFGLRNMTHKDRALKEMLRVCKPGGKVMVLEFSKPDKWLAPFYDFYSFKLMPWIAAKITGKAENYRYLVESIRMHPDQHTLATIMQDVGMKNVSWTNLTFGITALHIGYKEKS